jgi:hypothetical protein
MGLFHALADKKSMNALAAGAGVGSFKDFLRQRGEYPFPEDEDITVGIRARRFFGLRIETLLAVALAFGITNVISFTLGAWNSKETPAASVLEKLGPAERPTQAIRKVPEARVPFPQEDPKDRPARIDRRILPQDAPKARPEPKPEPKPSAPASEATHTIRLISIPPGKSLDEAREIEGFFKRQKLGPVKVRQTSGGWTVVEVGAFASSKTPAAKRTLARVRKMHHKFNHFRDAYLVRKYWK